VPFDATYAPRNFVEIYALYLSSTSPTLEAQKLATSLFMWSINFQVLKIHSFLLQECFCSTWWIKDGSHEVGFFIISSYQNTETSEFFLQPSYKLLHRICVNHIQLVEMNLIKAFSLESLECSKFSYWILCSKDYGKTLLCKTTNDLVP